MGQMKILVVDDEKLLVKGIKFNLEQDGYAVVTAFDGEEAIRLAHDESIDLILLDVAESGRIYRMPYDKKFFKCTYNYGYGEK